MNSKILIVGTIPGQLRALENMLKEAGCKEVLTSRNAKEAMDVLSTRPGIGMVITEWELPDKSGLEVLGFIRSNQKLSTIPVLLSFKTKAREEILTALKSGATGFIVKPYKAEIIKQKISGMHMEAGIEGGISNTATDLQEALPSS